MHPAPRHITEEELRVLEGCLHRWRSEVENDTRGGSDVTRRSSAQTVLLFLTLPPPHRSTGQYQQNPQNHRADVLGQIYDAGEQLRPLTAGPLKPVPEVL